MRNLSMSRWLTLAGLAGLLGNGIPGERIFRRGVETHRPVRSFGRRVHRKNPKYPKYIANGPCECARRVRQIASGHYQVDR